MTAAAAAWRAPVAARARAASLPPPRRAVPSLLPRAARGGGELVSRFSSIGSGGASERPHLQPLALLRRRLRLALGLRCRRGELRLLLLLPLLLGALLRLLGVSCRLGFLLLRHELRRHAVRLGAGRRLGRCGLCSASRFGARRLLGRGLGALFCGRASSRQLLEGFRRSLLDVPLVGAVCDRGLERPDRTGRAQRSAAVLCEAAEVVVVVVVVVVVQ